MKSTQFWKNKCYSAIRHHAVSREGVVVDEAADLEVAIGEDDLGNLADG